MKKIKIILIIIVSLLLLVVAAASVAAGLLVSPHYSASRSVHFSANRELVFEVLNQKMENIQEAATGTGQSGPMWTLPDSFFAKNRIWAVEIKETGSGCDFTLTESGEIHNFFSRFVFRYIIGYNFAIDRFLTEVGQGLGENFNLVPGEKVDFD